MNTPIKDGGAAFPRAAFTTGEAHDTFSKAGFTCVNQSGMTLRDWFAGQALVVTAAKLKEGRFYKCDAVREAYQISDEMIAARDKNSTT